MKQFLPLLLSALPWAASAQTAPSWTWAAALPVTSGTVIAPSSAVDASGNTYIAGGFAQTITLAAGTVLTSQGGQDGFLAKYGPTGSLLWHRQLGGAGGEFFQKVLTDASGNVTLVGLAGDGAQLGATTFATSNFGSALVLARLDGQGQVQYVREVGSGSLLLPNSLAADAAGNLYVSGSFALDATFGTFSLSTPISGASYGLDQFIVKVSPAGTPLWAQQGGRIYPGAGYYVPLFPSYLAADASGNVYFTWTGNATVGSFGNLALPAGKGDYDGLVVKFSTQGTPLWAQRLGGTGADITFGSALDAAGRLAVPGLTAPAHFFDNPATVNNSVASTGYLAVLEPTAGAMAWSRELQATAAAAFRGVTADAAGNFYVVGHFAGRGSLGGITLTGAGDLDALVACYSASGTLRWTQQSTGTGDESPASIALDGTNRLAISGNLSGSGQFGAVALSTPSVTNTNSTGTPFVAHLGNVVTAARTGQAAASLTLYPNPAPGATAVALPALPPSSRVTLLDALGRTVRQGPAGPSLPLTGLAPGLYEVQAAAPTGEQWTSRLVVE